MTDKELKRLRRDELLEMLIAQSKKVEDLQAELDEARAALNSREILLQEAGSIAEASIRINGVFEAAQAAAQQYLDNVRRMSGVPPEPPGVPLPESEEGREETGSGSGDALPEGKQEKQGGVRSKKRARR